MATKINGGIVAGLSVVHRLDTISDHQAVLAPLTEIDEVQNQCHKSKPRSQCGASKEIELSLGLRTIRKIHWR